MVEIGRLDQAAAEALAASQYTEAESDSQQAITLGLDSGVAHEVLASALDAQGKDREALQAYYILVTDGQGHLGGQPRNLLPYALLLLKAGRWATAVAAYNKALPHLADGKLMQTNSHFSAAVPEPTALATAIYLALGLTYDSGDDWAGHSQRDKALDEYAKALQLAPNSDLANYYYGYGLDQLGRTAQAAAVFQRTANTAASGAVRHAAKAALNYQRQRAYGLARHDPLPPKIINWRSQPNAGQ